MIDPLEIKLYRSAVVSDGSANGGRMGNTEIIDGAAANLFSITSDADRTAGKTEYRKMFFKVANDADEVGGLPRICYTRYTLGPDKHTFFAGTQTDTQATITGSEDQYGCGKLNASVLAAVTVVAVLVEDPAVIVFRDTEKIRISDKTNISSVIAPGGNAETVTIVGDPVIVGSVVTITFTPALQNGYSAADTYVSSVYEPADIAPTITDFVVTSAGSGDYNPAFWTGDSIGAIEQTWTLTFTSATAFNVVGDTVGALAAGSVSGGSSPSNPAFSKPYYVLAAGGFSGTWASGDTIVGKTHPAAAPVWGRKVVPAASIAFTPNFSTIGIIVASA